MTRAVPRTSFHSSKLIRRLADLGLVDAVEPGTAFAEKLGEWVHFADAITLSAVHGGSPASLRTKSPRAYTAARDAIDLECGRIQTFLVNSITRSFSPASGRTHIQLPALHPELPMNFTSAYAPYRRFYEAHQRDMDTSIRPLRTNTREALAKASPALGKLAELDAALETILRDRESRLLMKVPSLLRRRFEELFKEHQQRLADAQQADNPTDWMRAGGWLTRFCNDMQTLLLAEVEFRLQPTLGLIEAFKQDT
ncbi:DUF3348 domain-containing protein [Noviherbaspirillum sp.]|uniref:DUF3348 domain-containing protein n=1 Tax=Noviherbaspirillum sp. TaxID=1926288 RepID=UPI002FE2915A